MPLSEPITPGTVEWTGENPGILLTNDDGSFAAMALFFRVAWSPVGQGQVLLFYGTPGKADAGRQKPVNRRIETPGLPVRPRLVVGDSRVHLSTRRA